MTKCYLCGQGTLIRKKVPYSLYGVYVDDFDAEVCSQCGEEFFDEQTSQKITEKVKKKGLWGLSAKTKIGRVGSTLDIRFPKRLIQFLGLKKGGEVTVYPEDKKKIVIEI